MNRFHFRLKAVIAVVFVCSIVLMTIAYGEWRNEKHKPTATTFDNGADDPDVAAAASQTQDVDFYVEPASKQACEYRPQPCLLQGHGRQTCVSRGDEVYVPFNAYLRRQFDVSGVFADGATADEARVFVWTQSVSKIHRPNADVPYTVDGIFGPFVSYNVENRVPMSVQWDTTPYFYAIQIAQYALEHYSKNVTADVRPIVLPLDVRAAKWTTTGGARVTDGTDGDTVFVHMHADAAATYDLRASAANALPIVQLSIAMRDTTTRFTVSVTVVDADKVLELHYVIDNGTDCVVENDDVQDENVWRIDNMSMMSGLQFHFTYTIDAVAFAAARSAMTFTRNILTDVNRAITSTKSLLAGVNAKLTLDMISIDELIISGGHASITELTLRSTAHETQFMAAADWFARTQTARGGWPIAVTRTIADGRLTLMPGWHSAMAQGHVMSVLCRAYVVTGDVVYLTAAERATTLFDVLGVDGGVRNVLFGRYAWFEEYPTTPGSFVLNGFMYALVGLHDLMDAARRANRSTNATRLFNEGVASLHTLLPLYDGGSRSYYDLRHISLGDVSPNIARWDYHSLHVYQLAWLAQMVDDETVRAALFARADLWTRYARGEFAKHN